MPSQTQPPRKRSAPPPAFSNKRIKHAAAAAAAGVYDSSSEDNDIHPAGNNHSSAGLQNRIVAKKVAAIDTPESTAQEGGVRIPKARVKAANPPGETSEQSNDEGDSDEDEESASTDETSASEDDEINGDATHPTANKPSKGKDRRLLNRHNPDHFARSLQSLLPSAKPSKSELEPKAKSTAASTTPAASSASASAASIKPVAQDPILLRSHAAASALASARDSRLEAAARRSLNAQRQARLEKGRVRDVTGLSTADAVNAGAIQAQEKGLKRLAQRGVVKLFNAVRAAQGAADGAAVEMERRGAEGVGVVGMGRREGKVGEMSKEGFLKMLGGG